MARPEFEAPDFIDDADADEIQQRMMDNLPADLSKMEGDFPFDFTMPTAIEISQLVQYEIMKAVMIAFPEFAWDEWLDLHGQAAGGITRHTAEKAKGTLTLTGDEGTDINAGTIFAVPATDTTEDIEFETDEDIVLMGANQEVTVPITAVEAGLAGNVAAGSISVMDEPIEGVISIINKDSTKGGSDEEEDDKYYERIHSANISSLYFIGNDSDFKRWAMEIPGIGDCIVEDADEVGEPGVVRLILIDSLGAPASEALVQEVYDHIISPHDRSRRLLPTGSCKLICESADTKAVTYTCTGMILDEGFTMDEIIADFKTAVVAAYPKAKTGEVLRYNDIRPILYNIGGILDFDDFLMDGGHGNIALGRREYPVTGTITFTERQ